MSTANREDVRRAQQLCSEVGLLCAVVMADMDTAVETKAANPKQWSGWEPAGSGIRRAALKRRSLDLTRALAELRRS